MSVHESEAIINKLSEYFHEKNNVHDVEMAFVYGSLASGRASETSDVDLAVVIDPGINDDEKIFQLVSDLTVELSKRLKKEVEIIPIYPDFRKPMLYYNAIVLGQPVFISNKERYARLFNEALFYANDFELFGSGFQKEAAKHNLAEVDHG